jgi:hypothetical protein
MAPPVSRLPCQGEGSTNSEGSQSDTEGWQSNTHSLSLSDSLSYTHTHTHRYFERAWCLTEAFMFWKLSGSSKGGPFRKMCFDRAGALIEQDITQRPPDPSLGKLAFEAERVALSTMTAIMPYRDS